MPDNVLLTRLRLEIETAVEREMKTPRDFDLLAELIFQRLHTVISSATLKRLWGYLTPLQPREATLTILSRFLGYRDWEAYCRREGDEVQSTPIIGRWLDVERDVRVGDRVRLTWLPGRVCDITYEGAHRFRVVDSQATRLLPGDTFECIAVIEDEPLYLHNLRHGGNPPVAYVCGKRSGVRFERL